MPIFSDMNGFPESGFPVLSNYTDKVVLGTLYPAPVQALNFTLDVVGPCRLAGPLSGVTTLAMGGALSGVSSLTMNGALSGVSTLSASSTVTLSAGSLLITLGEIGSILARVKKAWLKDLDVKNTPTVDGDPVALTSDLTRYTPYSGATSDVNLGAKKLSTTGDVDGGVVNAVGGFKDNGTAGIDTTFVDADGNTITVSGGIITAKTAP